ncbi:MAG TPA: hypothetical protein VEW07_02270 [Solirubrobacterales bacterium]|nr:hypothetical protein [Solirubrobacterales bacterium]
MSEYVKTARGARALLNLPMHSSTAAIVAEIEDTTCWEDGEVRGKAVDGKRAWSLEPDYTLQIANCDRSISFELEFETSAERANNLHKVDTLIETLTRFREALADEQRLYAERAQRHS